LGDPRVPIVKSQNIAAATRDAALARAKGTGDLVTERHGTAALQPRERAFLNALPPISKSVEITKTKPNLDLKPVWFWNPSNPDLTLPAGVSESKYLGMLKQLRAIDAKIGLTFHPQRHIWQLWYHKPGFTTQYPWTNGWIMVKEFDAHQGSDYIIKVVKLMDSERVGSAKVRGKQMRDEKALIKEKQRANRRQMDMENAGSAYDFAQPKVGYGRSRGDKFARFG